MWEGSREIRRRRKKEQGKAGATIMWENVSSEAKECEREKEN